MDIFRSTNYANTSRIVLKTTAKFFLLSICTVVMAEPISTPLPTHPLPMQTTEARSVGTATNLKSAAQVLMSEFSAGPRRIAEPIAPKALRSLSQAANPAISEAARFFLVSDLSRQIAGNSTGLTLTALRRCAEASSLDELFEPFVRSLDSNAIGKDSATEKRYALFLGDPGVPATLRLEIVNHLSDDQILRIVGHPDVLGDARDRADEVAIFVFLARLSWLGTIEAEAISLYRVSYMMVRGANDHSISYWDGHKVTLSEKMITGGTGHVNNQTLSMHIGTFAHESGHAIFSLSGLSKAMNVDIARHHLTSGVGAIINEAVAGILQNRAHVAAQGYGQNKDSDANLVLAHDVSKNIIGDQTFYAKYYHVNTAVARAQFDEIKQVLADVIVPYFESHFNLLDDPQLAQTLPR